MRTASRFLRQSRLLHIMLFAAVYFVIAKFSLMLAFDNASASPVWPPAGLAIGVLAIRGRQLWPAVFIGAFMANYTTQGTLFTSAAIAGGNTVEALIGALAILLIHEDGYDRIGPLFRFMTFVVAVAAPIAASVGVGSLWISGFVPSSILPSVWLTWWLGDVTGAVILAPVIVLWSVAPNRTSSTWQEVTVATFATLGIGVLLFTHLVALYPQPIFLVLPLFIWVGFRFNRRTGATIVLLFVSIALWGTLHGEGVFGVRSGSVVVNLLLLQLFLATCSIGVLVSSALVLGMEDANVLLETRVRERTSSLRTAHEALQIAYDATLEGWVGALDLRDKETEGHTQRVTELTLRLARAMGIEDTQDLEQIRRGALLHDIGKLGVPDSILLKDGPLTDDEWTIMRQHPVYAETWLKPIDYLKDALIIPAYHHEHWDGTGYPRGVIADVIPFVARLFAVVDAWDALTHERPYKPAWSPEQARDELLSKAGSQFDPRVVAAFVLGMESGAFH